MENPNTPQSANNMPNRSAKEVRSQFVFKLYDILEVSIYSVSLNLYFDFFRMEAILILSLGVPMAWPY